MLYRLSFGTMNMWCLSFNLLPANTDRHQRCNPLLIRTVDFDMLLACSDLRARRHQDTASLSLKEWCRMQLSFHFELWWVHLELQFVPWHATGHHLRILKLYFNRVVPVIVLQTLLFRYRCWMLLDRQALTLAHHRILLRIDNADAFDRSRSLQRILVIFLETLYWCREHIWVAHCRLVSLDHSDLATLERLVVARCHGCWRIAMHEAARLHGQYLHVLAKVLLATLPRQSVRFYALATLVIKLDHHIIVSFSVSVRIDWRLGNHFFVQVLVELTVVDQSIRAHSCLDMLRYLSLLLQDVVIRGDLRAWWCNVNWACLPFVNCLEGKFVAQSWLTHEVDVKVLIALLDWLWRSDLDVEISALAAVVRHCHALCGAFVGWHVLVSKQSLYLVVDVKVDVVAFLLSQLNDLWNGWCCAQCTEV